MTKLEWRIHKGWSKEPEWSLRLDENDNGERTTVLDMPFENRRDAEKALATIARSVLENVESRPISVDVIHYDGDISDGEFITSGRNQVDIYNPGREFRGSMS